MADVFTKQQRSAVMRSVKGADTQPELRVRRYLHALGFRYSLHAKDLPGKPDIVLVRWGTVVFVHGCFWHGHPGCPRSALPTTRREYWREKIARNRKRDARNARALRSAGWRVLTIWECRIRDERALAALARRIEA